MQSTELTLTPFDNGRLVNLCGRFDEHLRQIERRLNVEIINKGNIFQIKGGEQAIQLATKVLKQLYHATGQDEILSPTQVHLALQEHVNPEGFSHPQDDLITHIHTHLKTRTGEIHPRSPNQELYVQHIFSHDINFGIGPAGTGKTFLAVACAIAALDAEKIKRIILVRPAVEAGERLGFLPGDLSQKIDPYLRPLYDALYEILGIERVAKLIERQVIEIASLAYMRGRTLNDAFIILDESQNTTTMQMKMFLTRIGFNSVAVITGDITQIDLPKDKISGLKQVMSLLKDIPGISFTFFQASDVVRHPIVQTIIEAYESLGKLDEY